MLPEKLLDETKTKLKEIFGPIFEELNAKEANDILVRASPKTTGSQVQSPPKKPAPTVSNNVPSNGGHIQT